jgi:hypothetical protein
MDDDQYLDQLMNQVEARKIRTLDDVATDVRSNLNKTVEGIIGAGKALQEGRDLHPSDQAFGNWCASEFPELHRKQRLRFMQIAHRFAGTEKSHQLGYSVLAELAAPSVSDDVVEQVINAPTPMKLAEVKALKKSVSTGQSEVVTPLNLVASSLFGVMTNVQLFEETNNTVVDPTELERAIRAEMHIYGERSHDEVKREVEGLKRVIDLVEQSLQDIPVSKPNLNVVGQEEADLISYQKQKQIEANPQQFDLLEHVKSTKHYDLDQTARCLNVNMEQLHWKSDRSGIKEAIRAAVIDDVIGIKVPALHGIAEILRELADEMPIINATKLN